MLFRKGSPLNAMKYPFFNNDIYKVFMECICLWVDSSSKAQYSTSEPTRNTLISLLKIKKALQNKPNTKKITDFRSFSKGVESNF